MPATETTQQFLTPVLEFKVPVTEEWGQTFHVFRRSLGQSGSEEYEIKLYSKARKLHRTIRQALFPTPAAAQRWVENQITCNGAFDI